MGRKDLRFTCKGCGYKASRRGNVEELDLNCPECGNRLVREPNPKQDLKFQKAKQEIQDIYSKLI